MADSTCADLGSLGSLLDVTGLKVHVHPNGFARLCFCFETILLSNAVF